VLLWAIVNMTSFFHMDGYRLLERWVKNMDIEEK
jgi:hypothetical protein